MDEETRHFRRDLEIPLKSVKEILEIKNKTYKIRNF